MGGKPEFGLGMSSRVFKWRRSFSDSGIEARNSESESTSFGLNVDLFVSRSTSRPTSRSTLSTSASKSTLSVVCLSHSVSQMLESIEGVIKYLKIFP